MNRQKVKAFTILEVTITMLIAGLVIGITFTAYSIIFKSYNSFSNKNSDMSVLLVLDHLLKRDFEQADIILKTENGITIKTSEKTTWYEFKPDYIIRNAVRIDTFKVQSEGLITTFENQPLIEVQANNEQNRVDEIGFTLLFQNEKIPYHYHKYYSSVNLIQRNPNAVN